MVWPGREQLGEHFPVLPHSQPRIPPSQGRWSRWSSEGLWIGSFPCLLACLHRVGIVRGLGEADTAPALEKPLCD